MVVLLFFNGRTAAQYHDVEGEERSGGGGEEQLGTAAGFLQTETVRWSFLSVR